MVMKLKTISPAQFFRNTLPRIYTDVKFNNHRVDPPINVLDPYSRGLMRPTSPWAASALSASGKRASSDLPPPALIATKCRRFLDLISESDEEEHEAEVVEERRLVKKLADEFDKVIMEAGRVNNTSPSKGLSGGSEGTPSRRSEDNEAVETVLKVPDEVNKLSFKDKNLKGKIRPANGSRLTGLDQVQFDLLS